MLGVEAVYVEFGQQDRCCDGRRDGDVGAAGCCWCFRGLRGTGMRKFEQKSGAQAVSLGCKLWIVDVEEGEMAVTKKFFGIAFDEVGGVEEAKFERLALPAGGVWSGRLRDYGEG